MEDSGITNYIKVGPTEDLETGNTHEKAQAIIKRDLEFRTMCEFSGNPSVPAQECIGCKKTKADAKGLCSIYQINTQTVEYREQHLE
jgi:hypothetical protein